ncbi:glutamine synthetase, partial [bacterium]
YKRQHCHQSLFDIKTGENLFFDAKDEFHLSKLAYGYIAGQLAHARGFTAVIAPSVNSYKRLVPGYEAPVYIGWAQVNRSALIRIPRHNAGQDKATRVELRCPDPSCNPYLAFATILACGMDGIDKGLEIPKPLTNVNVYDLDDADRRRLKIKSLPGSLLEALGEADKDPIIKEALGSTVYEAFQRAKLAEWDEYRTNVSDWEVERYLETV